MSLQSLLAQATCKVQRVQGVTNTSPDSSGGAKVTPYSDVTGLTAVAGRLMGLSGKQTFEFGGFIFEADNQFFTQQTGILNGDALLFPDGRFMRVTGIKTTNNIAQSSIPTYYTVYLLQVSLT